MTCSFKKSILIVKKKIRLIILQTIIRKGRTYKMGDQNPYLKEGQRIQ